METVTLLHTNDLHGQYENWLKMAAWIRQRKQELEAQGASFLLLDAGDHFDMSVNECYATEGRVSLHMLHDLGFHAMGVGNNELDRCTPEQSRRLSAGAAVPWLLANVREPDLSLLGGMKASMMMETASGLRVGLIGLTAQIGTHYEDKHGFRNVETVSAVEAELQHLQAQGAECIVVLSHLGYEADVALAEVMQGRVHLIVGGHSHTVLEQPVAESGVVIVQAGGMGEFVGELTFDFDREARQVQAYEGRLVKTVEMEAVDEAQAAILEQACAETEQAFAQVVMRLDGALSHEETCRWVAEMLRQAYQAEIGLIVGAVATDGLPEGDVTVGHIVNRFKSYMAPALFELTGQQIANLLQDGEKEEITSKWLPGVGLRPAGIPIGKLHGAGIAWDCADGEVREVWVNGEPLEFERVYKVASVSHLEKERYCGYPSAVDLKMVEEELFLMVKDYLLAEGHQHFPCQTNANPLSWR